MAGVFSDSTIEQIRAASDIVEVIGSYIPLKRAGANFVALCPFHREKSPSFNVNPHRQVFHCFGCHKGGDVFDFVKEHENLTFPEAVRRLAERAHIEIETTLQPGQKEERRTREILFQIHEQISARWHSALLNEAAGEIARKYLEKRGVSTEAVQTFRLGFAPDAWDDTVNWARSKKFELNLVEQGGLIIKRDVGEGYYDRFRGRLIFPICDEQGRVIGFSGRVLSGDEKTAKYVNSPESPLFTKGKVLFGLDKSKRSILEEETAIICEGQLDLISCFTSGVKNIVAPQGTALTHDHVRILKRYAEEVVLCFDSDTAGKNATIRSLEPLLGSGMAIRVAQVPAPHDPDSFIKANGGEAFAALIKKAPDFFDYYLNTLCEENDTKTDRGRLAVVRAMGLNLQKTGSQVLIDNYAQKTAIRLGVKADAIRLEFRKIHPGTPAAPREEKLETEAVVQKPANSEMHFLRLILENEGQLGWVAENLSLEWIHNPSFRELLQDLLQKNAGEDWRGIPAWVGSLSHDHWKQWVTQALAEPKPLPQGAKQLADSLIRLRNAAIDSQVEEIKRSLANPSMPPAESDALFSKLTGLKFEKAKPLLPPKT